MPKLLPPKSDLDDVTVDAGGRRVALTNLNKVYFPQLGLTKGDLLRYYSAVAPAPRPDWVRTCPIEHGSGSVIEFAVVDDLASLLWLRIGDLWKPLLLKRDRFDLAAFRANARARV